MTSDLRTDPELATPQLQQYFGSIASTIRALARGSRHNGRAWTSVLCDQLLVSGTSFLTTVLVGRVLGKHQLGLYLLAYSVVVVLLELQNSFIASPYTINSPRLDRPGQDRYTGSALALSIGLSALAIAGVLVGSAFTPGGFGVSELKPLSWCLSLMVAPLLIKEFGRRACFAYFRVREVLLLDVLVSFIQVGGLLQLTVFGSLSVPRVYCLMAIASGAAAALWMTSWRNRMAFTMRDALRTLRDTWSFGMWVLSGNMVLVLTQQVYPWYLASFKGPDATGTFAACAGLLALINPVISALGNYLGPATANASLRGGRELSRVVVQATAVLSGVLCMFCIVVTALGNRLLFLLYGSGYSADVHLFAVLAASVLASNCTLALGFGFWAIGRPDMNFKINLISVVIAAGLGPWLVRTHGLIGAAYGLLLANASVSILRVSLLKRALVIADRTQSPAYAAQRPLA